MKTPTITRNGERFFIEFSGTIGKVTSKIRPMGDDEAYSLRHNDGSWMHSGQMVSGWVIATFTDVQEAEQYAYEICVRANDLLPHIWKSRY